MAFDNNDRALIRVQNGKVTTVQIATNPVDVDQYHSAIIEFNIPDASDVQILETGKVTTELSGNQNALYSAHSVYHAGCGTAGIGRIP